MVNEVIKRNFERMYQDTMSVLFIVQETDPLTHRKKSTLVSDMIDIPCRLSFKSRDHSDRTELYDENKMVATLFLDPSIEIKPGSKITVNHMGRIYKFEKSGIPAIYPTHQEIEVVQEGKN